MVDKAKAVYEAMMNICPDCHHPWGRHLLAGCCTDGKPWCQCERERPADVSYDPLISLPPSTTELW